MAEAEAPATSATLYAVHKHVAARCGDVSAAFMACKAADRNPEVCLKQGAAVTGCVVKLCAPGHTRRAPRVRQRLRNTACDARTLPAQRSARQRVRGCRSKPRTRVWRMAAQRLGGSCGSERGRVALGRCVR